MFDAEAATVPQLDVLPRHQGVGEGGKHRLHGGCYRLRGEVGMLLGDLRTQLALVMAASSQDIGTLLPIFIACLLRPAVVRDWWHARFAPRCRYEKGEEM